MDALETYRAATEQVLTDYANFLTTDSETVCETVFDRLKDRYLIVEVGWENGCRIYGTLLHMDVFNGKLWIQHDGTEEGVAGELVAAGVPKDRIVLGFRAPHCGHSRNSPLPETASRARGGWGQHG